jgi:tetratricopeptide (TPR) repeat protein
MKNARNQFSLGLISLLILSSFSKISAQELQLFGNQERTELVKRAGNYFYNMQPDSASMVIELVREILPNHPIVPMLEALNIAWTEMPLSTNSKKLELHMAALERVIEKSQLLQEAYEDHPEGVFFETSARGIKSELYAREGSYLKSMSEARRMYSLMKKGFYLVEEHSEFLFMTGLYNYFREKYPERHPIYKPFMWVFRSGNVELGLQQMDSATEVGVLTKIEAHLYIAYVYLRYEENTEKAKLYLENLVSEYPNNSFFKSKMIECYVTNNEFEIALPLINELSRKEDNYYKMCGEVFYGMYLEMEKLSLDQAQFFYEKSLLTGKNYTIKGLYFKSLAYIGLGRIYQKRNNSILARDFYEKAIELNESDAVTNEAIQRLKNLKD